MYIYIITNKINKKQYVGLSTFSSKETTTYYGGGVLINAAIKKYGIKSFAKEIIINNVNNIEKLKELERYYILKYNTLNIGYNLSEGGDGCKGYKHTKEAKKKISKAKKGKPAKWLIGVPKSKEQNRKNSESHKGSKNHMYGRHHSEKTKKKTSQTLCRKYKNGEIEKQDTKGEKNSFYGKTHTMETKKKISDANKLYCKIHGNSFKGKKHTKESKLKMSKSLKKVYNLWRGHIYTDEEKKICSERQKGKTTCFDILLNKRAVISCEEFWNDRNRYVGLRNLLYKRWKEKEE